MNKYTKYVTQGGIIAALYVVMTLFIAAFNLASGAIQIRISEALCILPVFFPSAVPGLFVGCLLANLLAGSGPYDIILGSIATLIGAIGTRALRKNRWLAALPPIISNAVIIPILLVFILDIGETYPIALLGVTAGEVISVGILGEILYTAVKRSMKSFISEN